VGDLPAEEHRDQHDGEEEDDDERRGEVGELSPHHPAILVGAVHHVERTPGRAEGARRAVERQHDRDDQRGPERTARRVDHVLQDTADDGGGGRVDAVVQQVGRRVLDQTLLPDETERRDAHEQPREQRHHREVRERRRPVGHLVRDVVLDRVQQALAQRRAPGAVAAGRAVVCGGARGACRHASRTRRSPRRRRGRGPR
jgi:hypothetical protein